MDINSLRKVYHENICQYIIRISKDKKNNSYVNFSDCSNLRSVQISNKIVEKLHCPLGVSEVAGQTAGDLFEKYTKDYLEQSFGLLSKLRPGKWSYSTTQTEISGFDQYEHLAEIAKIIQNNTELASTLGGDYFIKPDIVISREPLDDIEINHPDQIFEVDSTNAIYTSLRKTNRKNAKNILHASISCKWTIRSDRSQNTRTEALNLIRNRKGSLPHIVAVVAEPLPSRIAALALGTGDLDCVYHFALHELVESINELENIDQKEMLSMMIEGKRLRDISDLPFDLAV